MCISIFYISMNIIDEGNNTVNILFFIRKTESKKKIGELILRSKLKNN